MRKRDKKIFISIGVVLGVILLALFAGNFLSFYYTPIATSYSQISYLDGRLIYEDSSPEIFTTGIHGNLPEAIAFKSQGYPPEPGRAIAATFYSHVLGHDEVLQCSYGSCSFVEYPDPQEWGRNAENVASKIVCTLSGTVTRRAIADNPNKNCNNCVDAYFYEEVNLPYTLRGRAVVNDVYGNIRGLGCVLEEENYRKVIPKGDGNIYVVESRRIEFVLPSESTIIQETEQLSLPIQTPEAQQPDKVPEAQPIDRTTQPQQQEQNQTSKKTVIEEKEGSTTEIVIVSIIGAILLILIILYFFRRRR